MPKLTKTIIDSAKAGEADVWIWDTELPGFGIRIQPSGRKTYVVRYRAVAGRTQRKQTLARCSDMPPDRARDLARKVFSQVAEGLDPAAERKPKQASTATLGKMFEGYIASMRSKDRSSAVEVERVLLTGSKNVADALGRDRPASGVTPMDIVKEVSKFFRAGLRAAADKRRSYICSAYNWAMRSANDYTAEHRQDWGIQRNPAADIAKDAKATNVRDRNLSAAELRELWIATERGNGGFSPEIAAAIRLLIGCGQRVQETLRVDGCEIDLEAGLWTMPAHKTKGRKDPHTVPIPALVLPDLRRLIERHGDGPLFPRRGGLEGELVPHQSINQAIGRWLDTVDMEHFQTRDLRRTWKSRAADAGVDRFTRDLIQQHAKSDTGSKHYDRSDYLPQMRQAMLKWSNWLNHVVAGTTPPTAEVIHLAA